MDIYGTLTSERASKGQGGNEFLQISVKGGKAYDGVIFALHIVPDGYGHANITAVRGSLSFLRSMVDQINEEIELQLKGNKQKGEELCQHGKPNGWCCDF